MEELKAIVQRMIDAGEPEDKIREAVRIYKERNKGKAKGSTVDPTMGQKSTGSQLDDGSSDSVSWFDQTWFGRGVKAASTTGEATNLMSENFSNISKESIQDFIKAKEQEAGSYVESERMKKFQEQYVKEGKTWSAFFRGVSKQPGLLPELFVQSLGTQVGTLIDSPTAALGAAATGAAGGAAVGAVPGAIAGAMGGLATSMEAALTFGELIETRLKEKNQEFTDENIKALLETEGKEIRNKALGRGLAIGTIEGFTGGLAGKAAVATKGVVKGAKKAALAAGATGVGVEAAGGALGEISGRAVAGQEMDAAEIGFEAITGTTTAPVNVLAALKSAKQPVYRLNGEKVTYEQMKDFVDTADDIDIAKADIQMENDFTGIGKKAKAKQEAAEKMLEFADDEATTIEVLEERKENIAERKYQDNMAFAKKHSKLYGLKFTELTEEEIKQKYNTEDQIFSEALGFIQNDEIVINKNRAKTKVYGDNVGNHELLHGIIKASKADITQETINDFLNLIGEENANIIKERIRKNYKQADIDKDRSEYFTIFSDAVANEEIKFNDSVFTKVKDFVRRLFATIGFSDVDFESAQGAYNFLKDYNKSIHKGSLSLGIRKATGGTAVFEKAVFSKEASDKVQKIYNDQGEAGAMDIIDAFKPITNKLVQRRSEAPNFDRQLLTDEIETGKRGIFDLIRKYDPSKGVPLAAYINDNLPKRAIEASKRVLGEEFTEDVSEKVDIATEEVAEPTVTAKPKPKKIVLADRLKVKEKVDETVKQKISKLDIETLNFKNLKDQTPEITGDLFGISPKKLISGANITKKELQSAQMFINKNADLLIAMLPEGATTSGTATGVPQTLLKAFYTKTDRAKMAKTGSKAGLAVQQKNNIKKTNFLETFGIIDGKPDRTDRNTSARVLALANLTGKMMTNQSVRQQLEAVDTSIEIIQNIKDGKSIAMFSKSDENVVTELGFKYNDTNTVEGAEAYVKWLANNTMFEEGFMNKTVAITSSSIPKRELRKYYKEVLSDMVAFGRNKKFARTKWNTKLVNNTTDSQKQALNKRNVDNFDYMWMAIYDGLQKDMSQLPFVINWLSGSINEGTHPHRLGAPLEYIDKTITGRLYFEHALQNANAYRILIKAAKNENRKDFRKTLNALKENYKLIAISAKDNKKIDEAGYKNVMSLDDTWNIFDNNWFERYFNEAIAAIGGINPENLIKVGSKVSIAQEFDINIAGKKPVLKTDVKKQKTFSDAVLASRSYKDKPKGISVLDFDDTLATTESLVKYTTPTGETGTLNAEEFASTYEDLQDQGFTFDFSDFNKVVKGKLAPLFNKALKLQKKFGPENMFVLTARPPAAAKAIFDFLKANGLNIPLKNITGLGNSTAEAKALWIADKVGEGYNDFYFADDALQNVQAVDNMLEQFDVKRKVQQAKVNFSKSMNDDFNNILEEVTGIDAKKRFSDIKARKRGEKKGKFRLFIPPSHEDFVGLLYNFMGKGRRGDQHRNFFEQALVKPLNRAYREIDTAKQAIANDYKSLNKKFADVKNKLRKKTPDGDFIFEDAVRVYLWNKHGYDIPGLSETDQQKLVDIVMNDPSLQAYAETLNVISKQEKYVDPGKGWEAGNIQTDLIDATGRVGRAEYFTEFNENADILFSEENLNKIQAAYGKDFRSALEDMLHRISTGVNRPKGQHATTNKFMNYLNGSVGTVMFFNVRSAILQQMSIVNYINFADNNIFAAAKAFANQKQYWADFAFIFNSDMLKQRRGGIGTDINGADLAQAVAGSKNPSKMVISYLLKIGFLPTQIGDNIAIATGGATFYRNRVNKYIKDGMSQKEAEAAAFTDFQDLTQSTQQSSRPDMTSQQQASWIGKLVLNFQNITSQYNRIIKKAASDIYNRRITPPYTTQTQSDLGNLSKILYYGGIQNVIFYSLQTALFAVMFDDDQDEDQILKKRERVINGSIDSILRGSGIYGAIASTLKNTLIKFMEQREKGYNKDESAVLMELLNFSPVVGIKARQIVNAEKTINYNENVISEMETFDADNPQWSAVTNYTQALTNFPANRLYQKSINMRNALDKDYTNFQRVMFFSGYTTWSLGLGDNEAIIEAKEKAKINKKNTKKKKSKSKPIRALY